MSGSQFSITGAIGRGYRLVRDETPYLSRLAALPVGVNFLTQMVFGLQDALQLSQFGIYLVTLPTSILTARFMFQIARLAILGEREGYLPKDPAHAAERRRLMQASVMLWLLVNAGFTTIVGYQEWVGMQEIMAHGGNPNFTLNASSALSGMAAVYNSIGLLLIGAGIWGIRFSVAHILAAVGFPIRRYIFQVNGIGISLRLLGLGLLIGLPALFLYFTISQLAPPGPSPNPVVIGVIIMINCIISAFMTAMLTASSCYALKDILGRDLESKTI